MSLQDVLGHMDLATYPKIAMVLFLMVFLTVSFAALRRRSSECERAAALPLNDPREVHSE